MKNVKDFKNNSFKRLTKEGLKTIQGGGKTVYYDSNGGVRHGLGKEVI